jgi:hypothetical protein
MVCRTRISDCQKYIIIVVQTDITYEVAMQFMAQAFAEASEYGIRNFLFDVRNVRNIESTENNYRMVYEDARRLGFDKTFKIGILIDLNDDSHDFVEAAANAAGFNCKMFTSEASMLE